MGSKRTADMSCPNCDESEYWVVLATTQTGVRMPGDSDARSNQQTKRELHICDDCGVCYDPVIANS